MWLGVTIDTKSIIFLGVKPKDAMNAYAEICAVVKKPKIVSLVAGIKSNKYLSESKDVELIRAMPNTSSQFNKGITAICNCNANKQLLIKYPQYLKK